MRYFGDFFAFLGRILCLYAALMLLRVAFYLFNADILGPIQAAEFPRLLWGSLVFDSASIFYLNIPFLAASLLPFRFRQRGGYQKFLKWLFLTVNFLGLIVATGDIFYFPFKLARATLEEAHFAGYGNFFALMGGFIVEYWYGVLLWAGVCAGLWWLYGNIPYKASTGRALPYYASQTVILTLSAVCSVILIRGGVSAAAFPINVGDATLYASPRKAALVLSNPFALIRTSGNKLSVPHYFEEPELSELYSPVHNNPHPVERALAPEWKLEAGTNIVLVVMESIATAHIKSLSDQYPADLPSITPFIDSLVGEGFVFTNAYNNGKRSIDALPALWASIPSLEQQFMKGSQALAKFDALPRILDRAGYATAFLHGAVHESMSFMPLGIALGIERFYMQDEYEKLHGKNDFDGKWGVWDHKFFPFAEERINDLPQPFFATLFTLSSHHPFKLPPGFGGRYPQGTQEIHPVIAYSDEALKELFARMAQRPWFENTLFILTADHGSGADNEKYLQTPYNNNVPLILYRPSHPIRGWSAVVASHIDLMPTLLCMMGYQEPYLAFGENLLERKHPLVSYRDEGYVIQTDSLLYRFNGREVVSGSDYLSGTEVLTPAPDSLVNQTKAYIQQYYTRLQQKNFLP